MYNMMYSNTLAWLPESCSLISNSNLLQFSRWSINNNLDYVPYHVQ